MFHCHRYINSEDVAEACCHAIYGLKALNQQLGKAGACEYVLQTLTLHPGERNVMCVFVVYCVLCCGVFLSAYRLQWCSVV